MYRIYSRISRKIYDKLMPRKLREATYTRVTCCCFYDLIPSSLRCLSLAAFSIRARSHCALQSVAVICLKWLLRVLSSVFHVNGNGNEIELNTKTETKTETEIFFISVSVFVNQVVGLQIGKYCKQKSLIAHKFDFLLCCTKRWLDR